MQHGNVFVKIVPRKIQGSTRNVQYMALAGYDPKVTHATCSWYETMSAAETLTEEEVIETIEKLRVAASASGVTDVTNPAVAKKLQKLFGNVALPEDKPTGFASLGIGKYL